MSADWPLVGSVFVDPEILGDEAIRRLKLVALAESWEPEASRTPPSVRFSRCAGCGKRVYRPAHLWLEHGGFKKELHLHRRCARRRGLM